MKAKKSKSKPVQVSSPLTYIHKNLKNLDMECYISKGRIFEMGMAVVAVVRQMPSGKFCVANFLLDVFCLGLKNTDYRFAITEDELEEYLEELFQKFSGYIPIDNIEANNLIYGAIDYAKDLGFKPQKDWVITKFFLNEDYITDLIDTIPFGKDGKPFYISGPYDNVSFVMNTLRKTVGEGNFLSMTYLSDVTDED